MNKMNILAIANGFGLFQPSSGGRNRFYNLVTQLAKRNRILILQPLKYKTTRDNSFGTVSHFRAHIKSRTFNVLTDFNLAFVAKFLNIVRKEQIDVIQVSHPWGIIATKLMMKLLRKGASAVVYDAHNVEGDAVQSYTYDVKGSAAPFVKKFLTLLFISYVPIQERVAVKCADYILAVSDEDKARFVQKYRIQENKIIVVPSGVDVKNITLHKTIKPEFLPEKEIKNIIFFHGSYFHPPNKEAIYLITDYLAPRIASITKNALFVIAGPEVPIFEQENIKSLGFVQDIYSLIESVDIAVVPILRGEGTRLKILDYMGAGLPIVTTKKGIEGIKAENMKQAVVVDNVDEQFIEAIIYLLNNEEVRKQLGTNARQLVEKEYDWERIGQSLCDFYEKIVRKNV